MKIIVMDYSNTRLAVIKDVPAGIVNDGEQTERFLESNGFHCSNCSWMTTEDHVCNEIEVFSYKSNIDHKGNLDINSIGREEIQEEYAVEFDETSEEE